MRDNDLFQLALGITSPWFVASSGFDAVDERLDIKLDFKTGARFDCPECKAAGCPVHDTVGHVQRPCPQAPKRAPSAPPEPTEPSGPSEHRAPS